MLTLLFGFNSIGSLARSFKEDGVENVRLTDAVFTASEFESSHGEDLALVL